MKSFTRTVLSNHVIFAPYLGATVENEYAWRVRAVY